MTLTQIDSSGSFLGALFIGIIITAVFLGIFLLIRSIMLWYWKIDDILSNQVHQTKLMQSQMDLLNKLVVELKKQSGNNSAES